MNQSSSWNPLDSMVGRNLLQCVPQKRRLDFHLIAPATCRQMTPTLYKNLYASLLITKSFSVIKGSMNFQLKNENVDKEDKLINENVMYSKVYIHFHMRYVWCYLPCNDLSYSAE